MSDWFVEEAHHVHLKLLIGPLQPVFFENLCGGNPQLHHCHVLTNAITCTTAERHEGVGVLQRVIEAVWLELPRIVEVFHVCHDCAITQSKFIP